MDREDMNLVGTHEPIDDPVRSMKDLTNERVVEFGNGPAGLWERDQPIGCRDQLGNHDRGVMRGILTDEGANRSEIRTGLMSPEDDPHGKNCFLTSSWGTSWPASD